MTLLSAIFVAIIVLAVVPSLAEAHLVTTGLGPFYDGAMHLLLSPGDLLGLLAAALLAGLRGTRAGRLTILVLPSVWYLSGLIGLNLPFALDLPWLSVLSFVILGAMVALDPKFQRSWWRYWPGSMALSTACSTALPSVSSERGRSLYWALW